ncbi:MAG: low-specificity L-threonine aldolase [Pseudomonadota bacterium]
MNQQTIDLRSDTVTVPDDAMRRVMASAEVGDDVYNEDPTVNRLQAFTAELTGHERALFFPSGTQSNLAAMMSHCARGEEYIVGMNAHTYKDEAGGAAVLGSIQPQPIEFESDRTLCLEKVRSHIKDDDVHHAPTRLFALENTCGGRSLPMEYLRDASAFASEKGLSFHLDGARLFNAVVAESVSAKDITGLFDSVSICLSKGLGAPIGSMLAGSKEFIHKAHRWRKMVGGGMRQVGPLAAAGLYALEHNVDRISDDHERAHRLACALLDVEGIAVNDDCAHTNMVFISCTDNKALISHCADHGLKIGGDIRLVTHKDISDADIDRAVEIIAAFFD